MPVLDYFQAWLNKFVPINPDKLNFIVLDYYFTIILIILTLNYFASFLIGL